MNNSPDTEFLNIFTNQIKSLFKPKRVIKVGDIGIFRNVFTFDTLNDDNHAVKYDVYMKVKAVGVYDELVEIEVMDVYTVNTCNQDIKTLIDSTMPKYVYPKSIKWEEK